MAGDHGVVVGSVAGADRACDGCAICSSWSRRGRCRASSCSTCWDRCCVGRGRSGWCSGPIGMRGRCRPSRWRRWRSRWSGSCTPWCPRVAGVSAGKWTAVVAVALVAVARMSLGVEAPTDVVVGVVIGVTIALLGFRWFTPNEVFPVTYRRGRAAHLDIGGARGEAIRRALGDQLGLVVEEVEPFGLAGSAGSTPMRIKVTGERPDVAVRQVVCPQPSACRSLVQARPRAAVWPVGGREAVPHGAAAGAAGGLRVAQAALRRPSDAAALWLRRAHSRAGVLAGHRVLRRCHRARRRRHRRASGR